MKESHMPNPAALTPSTRVSRAPDALSAEVQGNVVLLHATTGWFHELNAIGSYLWRQVAEPITLESLCARAAADFDFDTAAGECRLDIEAFVRELEGNGLVRTEA
jgi:hypothetical protein